MANKNLIWENREQCYIYFNREICEVVKRIKIKKLGCVFVLKILKIYKYIFIFNLIQIVDYII